MQKISKWQPFLTMRGMLCFLILCPTPSRLEYVDQHAPALQTTSRSSSTTLQATEKESSATRLFTSRFLEPTTQKNGDYQLDSLLLQPLLDSAALQAHLEPRTQGYRDGQPKSILSTPALRSADLQDLQVEASVGGSRQLKEASVGRSRQLKEASVGGSRQLKDTSVGGSRHLKDTSVGGSRQLNDSLPKDLQSDAATAAPKAKLPDGFYWKHYLRWHQDLRDSGIDRRAAAEAHYIANGAIDSRLYKPVSITLRYTACGGLFNQQYSHIAALTLAVMMRVDTVIWPPMQERASFVNRYNMNATRNEQTWRYLDADTIWNMPLISKQIKENFNVTVVKHSDGCKLPDMTQPAKAYQECPGDDSSRYDLIAKYPDRVMLGALKILRLEDSIRAAIQAAYAIRGGKHPTTVLLDLPCTFFMIDSRKLSLVEKIATTLEWSPNVLSLAKKVLKAIKVLPGQPAKTSFNGVHLRMEKDAQDWVKIVGNQNYWATYKETMREAGFNKGVLRPLYVACGLLKSGQQDEWSRLEMGNIERDILVQKLASRIVYKEMFLTQDELANVSNEASALIDFIVLRASTAAVGIGVSTFSFYLQEDRIMSGHDPRSTVLLMLPQIGTDQLFYTAAIVATKTRQDPHVKGRLVDNCRRRDGSPCTSKAPMGKYIERNELSSRRL